MFLLMSLLLTSSPLALNIPTHMRANESGQGRRLYWSHHLNIKWVNINSRDLFILIPGDDKRNIETENKHEGDALDIFVTIAPKTLKCLPVLFPPDAGLELDVTRAVSDEHESVGQVDHEVEADVGEQLLEHELVHGAAPPAEDLVEAAEHTGIAHIPGV